MPSLVFRAATGFYSNPHEPVQTKGGDARCLADLHRFEFTAGDQFIELRAPYADHAGSVIDPDADRLDRLMAAHSAGSSSR